MEKHYVICGHVDLEDKPMFYHGQIFVNIETGKFYGQTEDSCGRAEVIGDLASGHLMFRKKYLENESGVQSEIIYSFEAGYTIINGMTIPLGFWGRCEYNDISGEKVIKVASCVLSEV